MDTNIKGIKLNSFQQTENIVQYRTIQYADDVLLIMKDEDNALKIIKQFTKTTRLRLNNINKSEIKATGKFKVCSSISNIHCTYS